MPIFVAAIIKCLKRKVFIVSWPKLKMFCSVYHQLQVHGKYFCLTVWLKNINPWRLQQYISVAQVLYTWGKIFFVSWLGLKTFYILYYQAASYIIWQTSLMVRLRNIILWRFSAAMILKPCYGACLLLCIFVYFTFYILNFLLFWSVFSF